MFGGLTFLISQLFCYKCKHLQVCVEVSTPSKAYTTLCTLPLKSKCSVSVLTTVCCHTVSMFLPRGLRGRNNLGLTEAGFQIILSLITYSCTLTPATITSFNYALLFSTCFAKNATCPFMYFHSWLKSILSLSVFLRLQGADNASVTDNSDLLVKYFQSL